MTTPSMFFSTEPLKWTMRLGLTALILFIGPEWYSTGLEFDFETLTDDIKLVRATVLRYFYLFVHLFCSCTMSHHKTSFRHPISFSAICCVILSCHTVIEKIYPLLYTCIDIHLTAIDICLINKYTSLLSVTDKIFTCRIDIFYTSVFVIEKILKMCSNVLGHLWCSCTVVTFRIHAPARTQFYFTLLLT